MHGGGTFRQGVRRRLAGPVRLVGAGLLVISCGAGSMPPPEPAASTSGPTAGSAGAPSPASATPTPVAPVWADEFNGAAGAEPDRGKWTAAVGGNGWGNRELQYYTDRRANAQLDGNGHLVITALADGGSLSCWYGSCRFTSARLTTHRKFSKAYGRFEARIKIPGGQGVWPAFWLLGENIDEVGYPQSGEIDIMENIGSEPNQTYGALHGPGFRTNRSRHFDRPVADDFHVFAVDWTRTAISYSVDGQTFWTVPRFGDGWVFDHPFHIILNVAVGGWAGEPGDTTFPRRMLVDYVRVFNTPDT